MKDNNTTNWARGLKFVQWSKNNRHHSGIKSTPYAAMFSHEPKLGISGTNLPANVLEMITTEENLEAATNPIGSTHTQPASDSAVINPSFNLGVHIPISDVGSEVEYACSSSNNRNSENKKENPLKIPKIILKKVASSTIVAPVNSGQEFIFLPHPHHLTTTPFLLNPLFGPKWQKNLFF